MAAVAGEAAKLRLYSDPECTELVDKLAEVYGVDRSCVIVSNGSDEILNFAFMAFADGDSPLVFPDITYGFYPVFAELNRAQAEVNELMNSVNQTIMTQITGEEPSGCTHNCSTCGGCH